MSKKVWIVMGVVVGGGVATLLLGFTVFVGMYNGLVRSSETVTAKWSQVENVYQRRADLIPNLVETVKGYTAHERQTLEAVIQARASATQVKLDPATLTPEKMAQFEAVQGQLGTAIGRLLVSMERYPELKANTLYQDLMSQLEGTENRITVERKTFNDVTQTYNAKVKVFPRNLVASAFGFDEKPYFKSEAGSEKAPKVDFSGGTDASNG